MEMEITYENVKASFGTTLPVLVILYMAYTYINNAFCEDDHGQLFCLLLDKIKDKNIEWIISLFFGLSAHFSYTRRFFKSKESFSAEELKSDRLQLFSRMTMTVYALKRSNPNRPRKGIYFVYEEDVLPFITRDDNTVPRNWGQKFETKYYDYDFIQTYAAAQRYLKGDAATEESVVKDYKARKESHGTAKKQRVKTRVAKRRSSTPTRR